MHAATEDIPALNRPVARSTGQRDRAQLRQPLVRAPLVVEGGILPQHPQQVALVQEQQSVQALLAG